MFSDWSGKMLDTGSNLSCGIRSFKREIISGNVIHLRLLQTFAGVLQRKIHMRAVFNKTPTNYISIERL